MNNNNKIIILLLLLIINLINIINGGAAASDEVDTSDPCYKNVTKKPKMNDHHHESLDPLYFLFVTLLLGAITLYFQKKWIPVIPYTCLMFLIGFVLGICNALHLPMLDLGYSIDLWLAIDPYLLLSVFLPALIFCDAMKMEIHLFRKSFWQCFLLACPGVLISAGLMALVSYYILSGVLGYHFDWYLSFVFGSVLAATDPVSVVAMLESVHAPPKLTMLMSGESHLADLTSLVMFNLFLGLAAGSAGTPAKIGSYVSTMIIGGPLFGFALGIVALWGIRKNIAPQRKSDVMIQITITICLAYLSFIVSENNMSGNGVLATVSGAIVIAAYAWPSFANIETMENVWHAIEYYGNTLIFTLAGAIFGNIVLQKAGKIIGGDQVLHVLMVYVILYGIRFFVVLLFFPILTRIGYGLKVNEAVTVAWGGLRGAVAITLAIVVLNSPLKSQYSEYSKESDNSRFFFLVGGVVMLSLVVNSTTTPLLMKVTKVLSRSDVKKQLLHHVMTRLRDRAAKAFEEITAEEEFKEVNIEAVRYVCSSLRLAGEGTNYKQSKQQKLLEAVIPLADTPQQKLLEQVRQLFLDALGATYWEQIESGILPRNSAAAQSLLESCELAKDRTEEGLTDFEYLGLTTDVEEDEGAFHEKVFDYIDKCLPEWVTIDDYFGKKLHESIRQEAVFMASCFVTAHKKAQNRVAEYVGEGDDADSPEEVQVIAESEKEIEKANQFLAIAKARDPLIVRLINAKKVASTILQKEDLLVNELAKQGIIDEVTVIEFRDHLRADYVALKKMPTAVLDKTGITESVKPPRKSKKSEMTTEAKLSVTGPENNSTSSFAGNGV